jgi:hypothetical protein
MKKSYKILPVILAIIFALAFYGCSKSRLDLQNTSAYTADTYFNNSATLNQAVIATYAVFLHQGMYSREYYYIFDLLGNDAQNAPPLLGDLLQVAQYNFTSTNATLSQFWASLYRMIFRANLVIDRATAWQPTASGDQALRTQYIAEAKFMRSWANFNLVTLWGRVPLRTSYQGTVDSNYAPRAAVADIWTFIEQDLTAAEADLPVVYDDADLGRATKGAATALLGKTYLYEQKWQQAQTEFLKLTQSPFTYTLAPVYDSLFSIANQSNPETIFQVMHAPFPGWDVGSEYYMFGGQEDWGGLTSITGRAEEYGFNDWANVFISPSVVNAFTYPNPSTGAPYIDPRAPMTFYGDAADGGRTTYCDYCDPSTFPNTIPPTVPVSYPFAAQSNRWRKYEYYELVYSYGGPSSPINSQVIRYADVLLMLAETYIQTGNTGSEPLSLINQVRARVNAVPYTTLGDATTAMTILRREREIELAGEQVRFNDLIRWGIAKQTLNAEFQSQKASTIFQDKNVLLPIPQSEIESNPAVANDVQGNWN